MKRLSKMITGRGSISKAEAVKMTAQKAKFASLHKMEEEDDDNGDEAAAHRVSSTSKNVVNNQKKFVCIECGKAFQSSKAMCGHMASHSRKNKTSSNVGAKQKMMMEMDSDSDTESGAGAMRRRSMRTRYKKHDCVAADSKAKLDVVNNCSSEASGVEQEQEEVAICLMMLSRDSSSWGGLYSIGDASDNNSAVLEDSGTKFIKHNGLSSGYDLNKIKENYMRKRVESFGNFDSGLVRNEVKNVRSSRKNKMEENPHLSLKNLKSLMDGEGYSQIQRPKAESYPRRAGIYKSGDTRLLSRAPRTALTDMHKRKGILDDNSGNVGDDWKKGKHDSSICFKDLGSGNTLGYHCGMPSEDVMCDEVTTNSKRHDSNSHNFIDLNLPALTEDEEANESMGSY